MISLHAVIMVIAMMLGLAIVMKDFMVTAAQVTLNFWPCKEIISFKVHNGYKNKFWYILQCLFQEST